MKIVDLLKKLNKFDIITILIFSIGMLMSILDKTILNGSVKVLSQLPDLSFVIAYLVLVIFLFFTVKLFIKVVSLLRLKKDDNKNSIKAVQLLFIGYYIGFLISLTNAFIIVTFNNTMDLLT